MTENSDQKTPDTERVRLDTTGEFFSVGSPLHAVRAGYVRRAADNVLFETVVAGRYAHIIAPDRSGKSSLVAAASARLENNGFKVAILDLEQIGARDAGADAGRWYYSVAYRLLRQLRIRIDLQAWWQDKSFLSNRQRLVEFYSEVVLQNISERVVIFVDEIQCIAGLQFADELLASIRAAHNARATDPEFGRLTFVLLGECDPLSLIAEPELSPFNVTQSVALGDFSWICSQRSWACRHKTRFWRWTEFISGRMVSPTCLKSLQGRLHESKWVLILQIAWTSWQRSS